MEDDEKQRAERSWLSTLHDSRVNCREHVADAMVAVPDPNKRTWPVRSRRAMSEPHKAAMRAHVSLMDFADHLRPYEKENIIDDLWTEKLDTVTVDDKRVDISLAELEKWEFYFVTSESIERHELRGDQKNEETRRVLLPVTAMREGYKQLCLVMKKLGFAAESDAESLPKGALKTPEPNE